MQRASNKRYYIRNVEIKDYDVMTDGKKIYQPINNNFKTYENITKIAAGQGNDHATSCLLDYIYVKKYYKMIAVNW